MVSNLIAALATLLQPITILWMFIGTLVGIIAGILPGIGASLTMALLIPISFSLQKEQGLILLIFAWAAAVYGGSISSILINTPGTGANIMTCLDGFPMAKAGKSKVALAISATASMIGGIIGVLFLILFAPPLADFAMKFGPSENFMLTVFSLIIVSFTLRGSTLKGLISAGFGFLLSFIGYDILTDEMRYTFGIPYLEDGLPFLLFVIGLFAIAQIFDFLSDIDQSIVGINKISGSYKEGIRLTFQNWKTLIKSSIIGTIIGFAPGIGTSTASVVAYGEAERSSQNPDLFGKGSPEGVVAAESSNNAVQGGALIPTLTLGIPGNSDSAVFLAGLMMYGINPGRNLFEANASLVYLLFAGLIIAQIAFWAMGLSLSGIFSKITLIPLKFLIPLIWILSATGAYALHNNIIDSLVIIFIGILGYVMRKADFPIIPLLMAVILGPTAEKNFMRAMMISDGSFSIFFKSYINIAIIVLIVIIIGLPLFIKKRHGGSAGKN